MLLSGWGILREGEKGPTSPFLCPPVSPVTPRGQTLPDTRAPGKQKREGFGLSSSRAAKWPIGQKKRGSLGEAVGRHPFLGGYDEFEVLVDPAGR